MGAEELRWKLRNKWIGCVEDEMNKYGLPEDRLAGGIG